MYGGGVCLCIVFLFVSCSNLFNHKSDKGCLILQLPETNSSRAADNLESLEFSVTVTNRDNNIQQTKKGKSGDSFSFDLDTGFYNVKVSASAKTEPDTIIYEGEKNNVEVKSGKTTNVSMTLKRLKQTWTLDLSETIPYTRLDYNEVCRLLLEDFP